MNYTSESKRFYKWVTVQAYKHDGLLHRQWSPAYLALETDDFWALTSKASLVTECDGRRWMTKEPAVFFLFKKRWMNIIAMMKENGGIVYYVNVASPTILDNGFLKYIDYDLDVKLFPDGAIKTLDEQEFEKHIQFYGYSSELVGVIRKNFKEIQANMIHKEFPFNVPDVLNIFQKFLDENHPFQVRQ